METTPPDFAAGNSRVRLTSVRQAKTFVPGNRTFSVGMKAMKNVGPYILLGVRRHPSGRIG
jgi:hypothetical protein